MKISKLFHYLYAAIMFLPLLLLPVFMIYSHRHTIDSGSIDVPQNQVVDFNQIVSPDSAMTWLSYDHGTYTYTYSGIDGLNTIQTQFSRAFTFENGHKYINYSYVDGAPYFMVWDIEGQTYITWNNNTIYTSDSNHTYDINMIFNNFTGTIHLYYCVFDLTQMFGSGNEPTVIQFNEFFPIDAYPYTLSKDVLLEGVTSITYSDTDIMSQATYQLYNSFEKYFNMRRVFNLNSLYLWFSMTFFNGACPVVFTIIFDLFIYWLFVSLLWLLFDFFMYIPLVIHNGIDKARIE